MANISNEFARSSPIPESVLESETREAFRSGEEIPHGITALLERLTQKPELKNYKLIVNATSIKTSTQGPVRTYSGAFWNAEQDGTYVLHLESQDLLITISWIHS